MMRSSICLWKVFRDGDDGALEPGGKASQDAANAHFSAEQSQLRARLRELEVVYAHDLKPLGVDDLAIHEVAREKHLVRLQVTEADVGRIDGKLDALVVELVDVLSPGNHEGHFARPLEGEARDAGKTSPVEIARSEIVPIFSPAESTTGFPSIWDR